MKKLVIMLTILAMSPLAAMAGLVYLPGIGHNNGIDARVLAQNVITYNGVTANEYVIDIFASYYKGRDYLEVYYARLVGLDPSQILNNYNGGLRDVWCNLNENMYSSGWWGPESRGPYAAYADMTNDAWIVHPTAQELSDNHWVYDVNFALAHGMVNPWHAPTDYSQTDVAAVWSNGVPTDFGSMSGGVLTMGTDGIDDSLFFDFPDHAASYVSNPTPQLTSTIRLVTTEDLSDEIANGGLGWVYDDGWGGNRVSVLKMSEAIPEPATLSLLAIGGVAALIRRKK